MKKVYTLSIGLNDKDTKKQEIPTEVAIDMITKELLDAGLSCSISRETGIYAHEDKTVVIEESLKVIIVSDDPITGKIYHLLNNIKKQLNQESIMLEEEDRLVKFL